MAFWKPGTTGPALDRDTESVGQFFTYNENYSRPIWEQRRLLPIYKHREEILFALKENSTVILVGETGCGKTTQVPAYLDEAGWTTGGRCVICTQPRKVAAISVAKRVAEELGEKLGDKVGYALPFEQKCSARATRIKYCTDDALLRECLWDPLLQKYSVVMLDEAHERTVSLDILLGLLKKIRRRRPDLRVIISSATVDVERFRTFFAADDAEEGGKELDSVAVLSVQGRQYPVEILYSEKPVSDYLTATVQTVLDIHVEEGQGDILAFLPSAEDVDEAVRLLRENLHHHRREIVGLEVLPMFAALPRDYLERVFQKSRRGQRKVVLATNMAETSVTVDGVVFVVDSGLCKLPVYNPVTGMGGLVLRPISKSSARQRAGRSGRSRAGKCFRLYTRDYFLKRLDDFDIPQMQRVDVSEAVLTLKALGVRDVLRFDFPAPPSAQAMVRALEQLFALGALDERCELTSPLGFDLAEFPLDPRLGKMLLAALDRGMSLPAREVLLNDELRDANITPLTQYVHYFDPCLLSKIPTYNIKLAESLANFASPEGDHITLLRIYEGFEDHDGDPAWCEENCLSFRTLIRAREIRQQLSRLLGAYALAVDKKMSFGALSDTTVLRRSIVAGFFANAAKLHSSGKYRTLKDGRFVALHSSSVLLTTGRAPPEYVVFHEAVQTETEVVRDVCSVDPRWLLEAAPHFYESSSTHSAGSSGLIGLPGQRKRKLGPMLPLHLQGGQKKVREKHGPGKHGTESRGPLPVNQVGKRKGGLRSQF